MGRAERTGVVLSPDGTHIAYVATTDRSGAQIYLRDLRVDEMRVVSSAETPYNPFFSPDSAQIGFVANGKLWRAPVAGGAPFEIGTVDATIVAWHGPSDGFIYSGGGSGISRIPEAGGTREQITTVDKSAGEVAHRFPTIVPGGRGVLFTIYKGSLENARIGIVDVTTKKWRVLMDRTGHSAVYVPTGHLVYLRTGVLMAAPFDPSRLELTGPSAPVMAGSPVQQRRGRTLQHLLDRHACLHVGCRGAHPDRPGLGGSFGDAPVQSMFRLAPMPGSSCRRMARGSLSITRAVG